jgi:WD40 repeat protein
MLKTLPFLSIFALVALAASAETPTPQPPKLVQDFAVREKLTIEVQNLLEKDKFAELDAMADDFRTNRYRLADGAYKLSVFYNAFTNWFPKGDNEASWRKYLEQRERWIKSNPNSITARIALARGLIHYGYKIKSNGNQVVDQEGLRLKQDRMNQARKVLEEAEKLPVKDTEVYVAFMLIPPDAEHPKIEYEKYFQKGITIDPEGYAMWLIKAQFLAGWGKADDWIAFAEEAADLTKKEQGDALYARIIWAMEGTGSGKWGIENNFFKTKDLSWERMKSGFLDIEKKHPTSARNLSTFSYFACLAGDRETARQLFDRLGNQWDHDIWGNAGYYEKWKTWAFSKEQTIKPKFSIDLEQEICLRLNINGDGETLAFGCKSGKIILYNTKTNAKRVFEGHNAAISSIAFSPDHKLLATCSCIFASDWRVDGQVSEMKLWDIATGTVLTSIPAPKKFSWGAQITHDGTLALFGGDNVWSKNFDGIRVYDLIKKTERTTLPCSNSVFRLCVSPTQNLLATGGNRTISLIDIDTGKTITDIHSTPVHNTWVCGLAFSKDGKLLASCTSNLSNPINRGEVKIWDVATGKQIGAQFAGHPTAGVYCVTFSSDSKLLLSSGYDETFKLWDVATGKELASIFPSEKNGEVYTTFSPDGKMVVSVGGDNSAKFWDVEELMNQNVSSK